MYISVYPQKRGKGSKEGKSKQTGSNKSGYGIAAFDGHEMTGISESKRLNVVFVTTEARERYPEIPADLYVIEETGIEEFIVLQSANGAVFGYAPNYRLMKIYESLSDYITAQKTM